MVNIRSAVLLAVVYSTVLVQDVYAKCNITDIVVECGKAECEDEDRSVKDCGNRTLAEVEIEGECVTDREDPPCWYRCMIEFGGFGGEAGTCVTRQEGSCNFDDECKRCNIEEIMGLCGKKATCNPEDAGCTGDGARLLRDREQQGDCKTERDKPCCWYKCIESEGMDTMSDAHTCLMDYYYCDFPCVGRCEGRAGDDEPRRTMGCFSGSTTLTVKGRDEVAVEDLQVGDWVLTSNGRYQPVYAFGHHKPNESASFLQLHTKASEKPLEVSPEHLVFLHGKSNPVRSDSIQVGDVLQGSNGGKEVRKISTVQKTGVYAPFTASGTLIADDILASSYVSLQDYGLKGFLRTIMHRNLQMGMAPFRLVCMGVSPALCQSYNENGISRIFDFARRATQWAQRRNVGLQLFLAAVYVILAGICWLLELIFGPTLAPTMVLFLGGSLSWYMYRKGEHNAKLKEI